MSKRVRRTTSVLVCLMLVLMAVLSGCGKEADNSQQKAGGGSNNSGEPSGKVTIWGWDRTWFEGTAAKFNEKYPDIQLDYVDVAAKDYLKKVQTSVASGTDLPDIIWGEIAFRGALFQLNVLDDLSAEPYNFDTTNLLDFELPLLQNAKGQLLGLEQSGSPGAMAYKRNLAKEYFGTDDPKQLAQMFPDWETFIKKGQEVTQKSGGKVSMLGSLMDAYTILSNQGTVPVVDGSKVNQEEILKLLKTLQQMRDMKTDAKLDMWSPSWNASYSQDNVIFYPAANWSPEFVIKPNDKDSSGRWGLMLPPGGAYPYGGTSIGIWKDSKNKSAAWTYLNWLLGSDEGAQANLEVQDYLLPLKSFFQDTSKLSTGEDPYYGGQDLGKFWVEEVFPNIKAKPVTAYDQDIYSASSLVLQAMTQLSSFNADQALEKWKEELQKNHPELTFE